MYLSQRKRLLAAANAVSNRVGDDVGARVRIRFALAIALAVTIGATIIRNTYRTGCGLLRRRQESGLFRRTWVWV